MAKGSDALGGGVPARAPTFCTAINCLDGRVQLPVISHLRQRFGVDFVDMVTEPGPVGLLAARTNVAAVQSIRERVKLTLERHQSCGIGVVAHHDCAGNPVTAAIQQQQLRACVPLLREWFPALPVIALWVDEHGVVQEMG